MMPTDLTSRLFERVSLHDLVDGLHHPLSERLSRYDEPGLLLIAITWRSPQPTPSDVCEAWQDLLDEDRDTHSAYLVKAALSPGRGVARPELLALLDLSEEPLRQSILDAAVETPPLWAWMRDHWPEDLTAHVIRKDWVLSGACLAELFRDRPANAIPALKKLIKNRDRHVRWNALEGLAYLMGRDALPIVEERLDKERVWDVQIVIQNLRDSLAQDGSVPTAQKRAKTPIPEGYPHALREVGRAIGLASAPFERGAFEALLRAHNYQREVRAVSRGGQPQPVWVRGPVQLIVSETGRSTTIQRVQHGSTLAAIEALIKDLEACAALPHAY